MSNRVITHHAASKPRWYRMAKRDTAAYRVVKKYFLTYREFPSIGPVNWPVVSFVSVFVFSFSDFLKKKFKLKK